MTARNWSGRIPGALLKGIFILLVLAFVLAALPRPAQAACAFKYTVQSGDTLYGIAAKYGVTFDDLVEANKLKAPYLLYVGQVLCMPQGAVKPTDVTPSNTKTAVASTKEPTITGLHLDEVSWLALTNFPKNRFFYVNVYEGSKYYWENEPFKIGMISTDKSGKFSAWFQMPSALFRVMTVTFCVKDVINDDVLTCKAITNDDYFLRKSNFE